MDSTFWIVEIEMEDVAFLGVRFPDLADALLTQTRVQFLLVGAESRRKSSQRGG